MTDVQFIFYLVKFVVFNIKALLPTHFVIAVTTIRIRTEKLKTRIKICSQIYSNISFFMSTIIFLDDCSITLTDKTDGADPNRR